MSEEKEFKVIEKNDLEIKIKGRVYPLKITLGFWKQCGFKRDQAQIIEEDPAIYSKALKLAIFFGNKDEYGWKNLADMEKMVTDDDIDSLDEDYSGLVSFAMVHYLPEKLRKIVLDKMRGAEANMEKLMDAAVDGLNEVIEETKSPNDEEKKN